MLSLFAHCVLHERCQDHELYCRSCRVRVAMGRRVRVADVNFEKLKFSFYSENWTLVFSRSTLAICTHFPHLKND